MNKIVFLVRTLEGGGAERQLLVLAEGLKRRGHDVTIVVYYAGGPYEGEVQGTAIRYVSLEKQGFWDVGGFFWRAFRLLRRLKPDILHGYMDVGNFVAVTLKPALPRCKVVWGVRTSNFDQSAYDVAGRILSRVLVAASRWTDLIICNSASGGGALVIHGYPAAKIVVVPNGIDTERFSPMPEEGARLRRSWGILPDQPLIGLAARPDPMKGHETFAAAARLFLTRYPTAQFVCAGDWIEPYRSAVLATLQRSGLGDRLRWLGFVRDMPPFYSALDVSTSSSAFGEGVPNAIAESMACGVPCAVTDVGDSKVVVSDLGIVVPPRDPQALADAWATLLERRSPSCPSPAGNASFRSTASRRWSHTPSVYCRRACNGHEGVRRGDARRAWRARGPGPVILCGPGCPAGVECSLGHVRREHGR